ncbi:MAG TPA: nucleoside hydrolase, partial [Dongiaceae bacterium]
GVTAIAGNVPLALTEKNARRICELAGRPDIKVYAGAERPLILPLQTAEAVHGATGLDGPDLPEPKMQTAPGHASDFLVDTLRARPAGSVTLCLLGPHTNLALAMVKAPDIVPRIREIVMMGGAVFEGGNSTPSAEFNILVDPHAADVVFRSGVPITVMPLDVSHKALTTRARVDRIRALGTPVATAVAKMLEFFERYDEQKYGTDGAPLHDPCVISFLLQPGLFKGRKVNVAIEIASPLTLGMTVTDWWKVTDRAPNATVMTDIDADAYYELLTGRLARL